MREFFVYGRSGDPMKIAFANGTPRKQEALRVMLIEEMTACLEDMQKQCCSCV